MFRHLFKLIWNKKKQNFLLIFELLISFMVVFAVFTLLINKYRNYKKPMGFEYENVWVVNYNNPLKTDNTDSLNLFYETVRQTLLGMPQITGVSFVSENLPFSNSTNGSSAAYNNKEMMVMNYHVEGGYKDVLNVKLLEGRWFEKQDAVSKNRPVVINASLKQALFGNTPAVVGKLIGDGKKDVPNKIIIGVVEDMKDKGDYSSTKAGLYNRADTASFRWINNMLIKVRPGTGAAFESRLYKTLANSMKNANVEIAHLTDMRRSMNKTTIIPIIVLLVVAGFLIINVALGIFGVLWYNINKRKSEIGLRRAVGASGNTVSRQLVGEALVLATISLFIGSFFAVQFPLLNVFDVASATYLTALAMSLIFIYLLVIVCALYPGKQAAAIHPSVALHEE